jgi:hypothetical protein
MTTAAHSHVSQSHVGVWRIESRNNQSINLVPRTQVLSSSGKMELVETSESRRGDSRSLPYRVKWAEGRQKKCSCVQGRGRGRTWVVDGRNGFREGKDGEGCRIKWSSQQGFSRTLRSLELGAAKGIAWRHPQAAGVQGCPRCPKTPNWLEPTSPHLSPLRHYFEPSLCPAIHLRPSQPPAWLPSPLPPKIASPCRTPNFRHSSDLVRLTLGVQPRSIAPGCRPQSL